MQEPASNTFYKFAAFLKAKNILTIRKWPIDLLDQATKEAYPWAGDYAV